MILVLVEVGKNTKNAVAGMHRIDWSDLMEGIHEYREEVASIRNELKDLGVSL